MQLYDVIWKDQFVEKLVAKHGVATDEVEEVLFARRTCARRGKDGSKARTCMSPTGKQRLVGIWLSFLSANAAQRLCPSQPAI